jgi:pimeloyl-ACP methyl ester carboxylesterase
MKEALLLPGYLDSPDYRHMVTLEKGLQELGYRTERIDACNLWSTGDVNNYSVTNFLEQIKERVEYYSQQGSEEIVLVGHSVGGMVAIIAGNRLPQVTKIVALCPPPHRKESVKKWVDGFRRSKKDLPNNPEERREIAIPESYIQDALQYSASDEVKEIHKPLMILIAQDDTIVKPELTEEIVNNANDPYVVRVPNIGHDFRFSQDDCNKVMDEVEKFLTK